MIETIRNIPRAPTVRRSLAGAPTLPLAPLMISIPPQQAVIVFENTPRTSLEDMLILAEAAAEETEIARIPSAAFTPRGVSLSRYATHLAGMI